MRHRVRYPAAARPGAPRSAARRRPAPGTRAAPGPPRGRTTRAAPRSGAVQQTIEGRLLARALVAELADEQLEHRPQAVRTGERPGLQVHHRRQRVEQPGAEPPVEAVAPADDLGGGAASRVARRSPWSCQRRRGSSSETAGTSGADARTRRSGAADEGESPCSSRNGSPPLGVSHTSPASAAWAQSADSSPKRTAQPASRTTAPRGRRRPLRLGRRGDVGVCAGRRRVRLRGATGPALGLRARRRAAARPRPRRGRAAGGALERPHSSTPGRRPGRTPSRGVRQPPRPRGVTPPAEGRHARGPASPGPSSSSAALRATPRRAPGRGRGRSPRSRSARGSGAAGAGPTSSSPPAGPSARAPTAPG